MSGTIDRPLADVGYIGSVTFRGPERPQEPDATRKPLRRTAHPYRSPCAPPPRQPEAGHEARAAHESNVMEGKGFRKVRSAWRR